jgi:hypothetical protein
MEHHLSMVEITQTSINHYNLGAYFCRKFRKKGGVSIFVQQNLQYTSTDLDDQEIEVCAIKLNDDDDDDNNNIGI